MNNLGINRRVGLLVLFLLCGLLVFVAPDFLKKETQVIFQICVTVAFLLIALRLRKNEKIGNYFQVTFAFFIVSLVTLLDNLISLSGFNSVPTVSGSLLRQFMSTLVIVVPIVLLNKLSGNDMGSIYLQKGRLRLGLIIGLGTFLFMLVLILIDPTGASTFFPVKEDITHDKVLTLMPVVVTFVLLNGIREELWFRGVFLKKLEPVLGAWPSNILIAFVFAVAHVGVEYTPVLFVFLAMTFALGLAWGYVMQKTNSIIGSALFHAAMDMPVILGVFSFL